jgi:hypothetical protein
MSAFIMTDDDALPENASFVEDVLELSLLTAGSEIGPVDVSRKQLPEDY